VSGADKLLISKLLPLANLTYYSMASTATGALQFIYLALQTSLFPRLAAAWHREDRRSVCSDYLLGMRVSILLCAPLAFVLMFFPESILLAWTRSPALAGQIVPVLPVLALATLFNCAQGVPLNALLATGETRLPLVVNISLLPLVAGGCFFAVRQIGLVGAAYCWCGANLVCLVVYGYACAKRFSVGGLLGGLPLLPVCGQLLPFVAARVWDRSGGNLLQACVVTAVSFVPGFLLLGSQERESFLKPIRNRLYGSL